MANPGVGLGATALALAICNEIAKGYQFYCNAVSVPNEYRYLVIRMQIEQQRFEIFSEEAGLIDSDPGLCDNLRIKESLLVAILQSIRDILEAAAEQHMKYVKNLCSSDLSGNGDDISTEVVDRLRLAPLPPPTSRSPASTTTQRLHVIGKRAINAVFDANYLSWGAGDQKAITKLVEHLTQLNSSLTSLLDSAQKRHQQATLNMVCRAMLQKTDNPQNLRYMQKALNSLQGMSLHTNFKMSAEESKAWSAMVQQEEMFYDKQRKYLQRLVEMKKDYKETLHQLGGASINMGKSPLDNCNFVWIGNPDHDQRPLADYNGKAIWVEWKNTKTLEPTKVSNAENQVKLLADLIGDEKPESFRTPPCLGYVVRGPRNRQRWGIAFELPNDSISVQLKSLRDCIAEASTPPSLTQRIALCATMTDSIYNFHTIGWIHKGIRSENIVFLVEPDQFPDLNAPFLAGFHMSRPNILNELTEIFAREPSEDMYRHPEARKGSHQSHDIYSLGLMLIEIATWKLLEDFLGMKPKEINVARDHIVPKLSEIAFVSGDVFKEVVYWCLHADGEEKSVPSINQPVGGGELLKDFGRVVEKLSSLSKAI